jgi:hypothetical protein
VIDGIQTPGPLPTADAYANYLARGKQFTIDVLMPGGLTASKGTTTTAKLKKYFLAATGAQDLKDITVPQWESVWAQLAALAREGNEKAAVAVQNLSCTCNEQTTSDALGAPAVIAANTCPAIPSDFTDWLQRGEQLVKNHKDAKWALGYWLLETVRTGAGLWPHIPGVPPDQWIKAAAEHYGYTYDTFLQFKRVAAAFPPATRVAALSWHHHQAVAGLAEPAVRAEWLRIAGFAGWSSKELQTKVAISKCGLTIPEALKVAELAAVLGVAADAVQVLIVREFLGKNDIAMSEFVFRHRESFE